MNPDDVTRAFQSAKAKRAEFLARRGWVLSTDFPDSRPRWVKTFTTASGKQKEFPMSGAGAFALERSRQ